MPRPSATVECWLTTGALEGRSAAACPAPNLPDLEAVHVFPLDPAGLSDEDTEAASRLLFPGPDTTTAPRGITGAHWRTTPMTPTREGTRE